MFAKMLPAPCTIIRDGKESRIAAENLVIGDIVKLNLGDRIPADMRLIDVKDLKVEMSSMTGEPDAITCFFEKPNISSCNMVVFETICCHVFRQNNVGMNGVV
jgi:P-type E1-E2 ATPase